MAPAICPVCDLIRKAKVNPEVAVICALILGAVMRGEDGIDLETCSTCDMMLGEMMGLHQDATQQGEAAEE